MNLQDMLTQLGNIPNAEIYVIKSSYNTTWSATFNYSQNNEKIEYRFIGDTATEAVEKLYDRTKQLSIAGFPQLSMLMIEAPSSTITEELV